MNGTVILSHGLESGPEASKVTALAEAAERLGFSSIRPDYRDLDASFGLAGANERLLRLLACIDRLPSGQRIILAGSSFGAFISGLASLARPVNATFLIALPLKLPGFDRVFDLAPVPSAVIHGWRDELIPADAVFSFCRGRCIDLHLLDDSHRLANHVEAIAVRFASFLQGLS